MRSCVFCDAPALGSRGPARCAEHRWRHEALRSCKECGVERSEDDFRTRTGLCGRCYSSCRICGEPRGRSDARARLCDAHAQEAWRLKRPKKLCALCGSQSDGKLGPARCADCRGICGKCGDAFKPGGRCQRCRAEFQRLNYRRSNGIPVDAGPAESCRECGGELSAAANHRNVTMTRKYCSTACRNRSKCRRRRVQRAGRPFEHYAAADVFERDGWVCRICEKPIDRSSSWPEPWSASIDHVVPIAAGGSDVPGNVQAAHFRCNILKGDKVAS